MAARSSRASVCTRRCSIRTVRLKADATYWWYVVSGFSRTVARPEGRALHVSSHLVTLLASLVVAAAVAWAALYIAGELRAAREEASRERASALLALFAPAIADAQRDPRAFLVWQPIASIVRQLFPTDAAALDRAAGGRFPFTTEQIQNAHAQWTADWLAWERTHDAEYKRKAAAASARLAAGGDAATIRGELDAIEQEKLDLYQRRYTEYVRIGKALQSLNA